MSNKYPRTNQDKTAEFFADSAAAEGKWKKFVELTPDNQQGLQEIAVEGHKIMGNWQLGQRAAQKAEIAAADAQLAQWAKEQPRTAQK